jgi:hypothetical protein
VWTRPGTIDEHGDEKSGSIKRGAYLDQTDDYGVPNGPVPWIYVTFICPIFQTGCAKNSG